MAYRNEKEKYYVNLWDKQSFVKRKEQRIVYITLVFTYPLLCECSHNNGAGMRVSPVGLYARTLDEALALAALTASVSHNHPEGVKGAQAIAACVFLCKQGKSKQDIKEYVEKTFDYNLHRTIAEIRPRYGFEESCQRSVPEAIIAFLEGNSFEEVIRLAISLGGDSDTIGCMAGSIAACMYPIPIEIAKRCDSLLTEYLKEIKDKFCQLITERGKV